MGKKKKRKHAANLPAKAPETVAPSQAANLPTQGDATRAGKAALVGLHVGPLPPPAMLADYEKAFPGTAERILRLTETEAEHRRAIDMGNLTINKRLADGQVRATYLGMIGTLLLGAGATAGGVFLIYNGKSIEGLTAMLGVVLPIIVGSIWRRRRGAGAE